MSAPNRREVLTALVAAGATYRAHGTARTSAQQASLVLVHGAWHGGWCWRYVIERLRDTGARIFAPTLTGLADRSHLRDPVPTLTTHVDDVVGLIEAEELDRVVLVGHSYAGMVITVACDRLRQRVAHVVYLDAVIPEDGQNMLTQFPGLTPEQLQSARQQLLDYAHGTQWLAPFSAATLGIPAEAVGLRAWVDRRLTPHPLPTLLENVSLSNGGSAGIPRSYLACTSPPLANSAMPLHAARVRSGAAGEGWRFREIRTGHDAMVTEPDEVARILRGLL